jgi:hypothetical protein
LNIFFGKGDLILEGLNLTTGFSESAGTIPSEPRMEAAGEIFQGYRTRAKWVSYFHLHFTLQERIQMFFRASFCYSVFRFPIALSLKNNNGSEKLDDQHYTPDLWKFDP